MCGLPKNGPEGDVDTELCSFPSQAEQSRDSRLYFIDMVKKEVSSSSLQERKVINSLRSRKGLYTFHSELAWWCRMIPAEGKPTPGHPRRPC